MQNVIEELKKKGLVITEERKAKEYLEYNTSWQLLKVCRIFFCEYKNNNYNGITFDEIRKAGLVAYHYNKAFEPLIKACEHQIKVLLSREYQKKRKKIKSEINEKVKTYIKENIQKYKKEIGKINKILDSNFEFFQLYDYYYFYDLIKIYNEIFGESKYIDPGINKIRNALFHQDNILHYKKEKSKPTKVRKKREERILNINSFKAWESQQQRVKNFMINNSYNLLITEQIFLLDSVEYFLSQSPSTKKMKKYIFDQYVEEFEKAEKYLNQLKSTEKWLRYSFKIMSKYKEDYKNKIN